MNMNRFVLMTLCCAAAALSGTAAADPLRDDQNRPELNGQRENQTRQDDPVQRDDQSRQDPDQRDGYPQVPYYSAELRKCDSLSGAEKTRCVDAVKRKFGQM